MKKILLSLLFFASAQVFAQELSIETLWDSASSFEKLQQSKVNVSIADLDLKVEKGKRLPLIYAEGNLQRNLITPVTPVPAIAFNPNAAPGEILPLKFATDWSSKVGINLSLNIFNPQTKTAIQIAEIDKQSKLLAAEKTLKDWKKDATSAYAKVVLSTKQYEQAIEDTVYYQEILNIIHTRFNAGRASELDFNKAKQELLNKKTQLAEAYKVLLVANSELAAFVEVEKYSTLSTSISRIIEKLIPQHKNIEIEQLNLSRKKVASQLNGLRLEALPTLTLNSFYGSQFFNNNLSIWDNKYWNGNAYINVGIRLPISEALERGIKKRRFTLEQELLESQYRDQVKADIKANNQYNATVVYTKDALENAQKIESIAVRNLEIVRLKYDEGKILLTELNSELSNLFNLKQKTWQASYDYLLAVIDQNLQPQNVSK